MPIVDAVGRSVEQPQRREQSSADQQRPHARLDPARLGVDAGRDVAADDEDSQLDGDVRRSRGRVVRGQVRDAGHGAHAQQTGG